MATTTFTATTTWTCPAGLTSIQVECWGGGGAGGTNGANGGSGGGGGAYSIVYAMAVVPTTVYTVTVGAASTGTGNDSWFNSTGSILAKGGADAGTAGVTASGGLAASGVGDLKFDGGTGGAAATTGGAGGGGGAGSSGAGNAGGIGFVTGNSGGVAKTVGGGAGGGGSASGVQGADGSAAGGGGGGSGASAGTRSSGARGRVDITWVQKTDGRHGNIGIRPHPFSPGLAR